MREKFIRKLIMLIMVVGSQCAPTFGESSNLSFRFQGRLTDSQGRPIAGNPAVKFDIFPVASGGLALWSSATSKAVNSNSSGLFTTDVGPLPMNIFSAAAELYLQISIRGIGEDQILKPRQKLTYVPFAIRAELSDKAEHAKSIEDGAVTAPKIAPEAVREINLASASVTSVQIKNNSILHEDIGVNAVTSTNIAIDSINEEHLKDRIITADKIQEGAITEDHLSPTLRANNIPSGMIMMSTSPCPLGWSHFSLLDGLFLQGGSFTGIPGGSKMIAGLSTEEAGAHQHVVDAHRHAAGDLRATGPVPISSRQWKSGGTSQTVTALNELTLGVIGQTAEASPGTSEGGTHMHVIHSDGSWLPPYLTLNFCQKN